LPGGDFVQDGVCYRADQVRRDVDAIEIAKMSDDLSHAHAASVHRDDFLVEAGKPPLVLGDQVRIEARPPISRHIQLYPSGVGNYRLLAIAVAAVAGLAIRKMMIHLGVQRPLGQRFLQIVQKAVRIKGRLGISATMSGSSCAAIGCRTSSSTPNNEIIDAACDAWRNLEADPERITSIGMRKWAHIGHSP
jgi:hypothetical protein